MIFWLSTILFFGCQTASTQVTEAVMLEQQGDSVAAFDIYKSILEQHPNTPEAKTSLRRIQRMQLQAAKSLEKTDPKRALALYQSMLDRWPDSEYGQVATQKIAQLSGQTQSGKPPVQKSVSTASKPAPSMQDGGKEGGEQPSIADPVADALAKAEAVRTTPVLDPVLNNDIIDEAELAACDTARSSQSRLVWQQYKQTFPNGACLEEAEEFLRVSAPRQMELDQGKAKAVDVKKALVSLCKEYRLVQTTSNPKACDDPSRALMTEFARLQKRKADLLASGEADKLEYYEKWIPPRWNKLSAAEKRACGDLVAFVDGLAAQGIDRSAIESELSVVRTCFVDQGNI